MCVFSYSLSNDVNACDVGTSAILFNCSVDIQIHQELVCFCVYGSKSLTLHSVCASQCI